MMKQVRIDRNTCSGCGVCIQICPYGAIILEDDKAVYSRDGCFLCGHCRAVCPAGAVQLAGMTDNLGLRTIDERPEVIGPGDTSVAELVSLMRSRRSCRQFQETPVELDLLTDLVKIGTTAPSGTNSQPWEFVIIPSRYDLLAFGELVGNYYRKLNRLAANPFLRFIMKIFGNDSLGRYYRDHYESVKNALQAWDGRKEDRLFHGAVAGILVAAKKDASCPAEDAMLATQNILLAAHALGLGSCLIGFAVEAVRRSVSVKVQMEVAANEEIYAVIALGYPAATYLRPTHRRVVRPRIAAMRSNL